MSLIGSIRTYLLTYSGLVSGAGLLVDTLGKEPTQYSLVPLPGARIVQTYINGATVREFAFAVQSMESTADDPARIANHEFLETLADWIESQNEAEVFPTLDSGKTPVRIEVLGQPILFEFGESGTGIYQLQCRLTYEQTAL